MINQIDTKEIQKIVNFIKVEKFDLALNIIKKLSVKSSDTFTINKLYASTYFKKRTGLEQSYITKRYYHLKKIIIKF